jgi:hypothetical protein
MIDAKRKAHEAAMALADCPCGSCRERLDIAIDSALAAAREEATAQVEGRFKAAFDELHIGAWEGNEIFLAWAQGQEKPHAIPPVQTKGFWTALRSKFMALEHFKVFQAEDEYRLMALREEAKREGADEEAEACAAECWKITVPIESGTESIWGKSRNAGLNEAAVAIRRRIAARRRKGDR